MVTRYFYVRCSEGTIMSRDHKPMMKHPPAPSVVLLVRSSLAERVDIRTGILGPRRQNRGPDFDAGKVELNPAAGLSEEGY